MTTGTFPSKTPKSQQNDKEGKKNAVHQYKTDKTRINRYIHPINRLRGTAISTWGLDKKQKETALVSLNDFLSGKRLWFVVQAAIGHNSLTRFMMNLFVEQYLGCTI